MRTVTIHRTIDAPIDAVFAALSDASTYTGAPLIVRSTLVKPGADAPYGLGAIREIIAGLAWFREEITAYDPPHSFEYRILRSIPATQHEEGRIALRETAEGTELTWTTTFTVRMLLASEVLTTLAAPIIRTTFNQIIDAAIASIRIDDPQHPR
ncbi:SRPBCC family protein [Nocardia sp. NPDC050175]|uniref:SRPBCC family protein n=1 Tax=Nocardia sp. NPDC050175 TaxID=3364317 RepID=UPI0037BB8572